ncbi:MAG TPA: MFS transporter [Candidatus Acidoferrales bacterium]|nr:MFS transporter [Candidatus Acidoferrales bacterium]
MATTETERPAGGPLAGIGRNIVALGFTSLFTDVSTEMLVPILPLFVTATLHASVASLGVIEGVAECTASVLRTTSGWLSDRIGRRKPFVVLGYGLSGLAKAALGLAGSWPAVLALRFTDRVGKGLRNPPRDALIADSAPPEARGRAFGLHRAMDTTGAAIGPLLGWWLLHRWHALGAEGYRRVFLASAIPAALSVLVLLVFVRAPRRAPAAPRPRGAGGALGGALLRFLAVDAIFQLGNSSNAFVLLRTQGAGWNASQVMLIYLLFNVVYALLALPFGHLSDRIGRRPLLLAAYALYAVAYALFGWHATRAGVVAGFLVLAVHSALIDGQARALVSDLVPATVRATAYGVQATVVGVALLPASVLAGMLWERVGPAAPFVLGASLAALAAVLLPILLPARAAAEPRRAG